jgi:hypothetical protein
MTTHPRSADGTTVSGSDRRSVGTDQRLNPYALYMSEQGRTSNVSLQDNHDYSRQLRVSAGGAVTSRTIADRSIQVANPDN